MFWEKIEPILTDDLLDVVDRSYKQFEKYKITGTIIHCACNVCMSQEDAKELSILPLTEISATLLAEYTNSAHGYDRNIIEREFKHFLPRYFDLIAHCDPPSPSEMGIETCLVRLNGYKEHWPKEETELVDKFFVQFLKANLSQISLLKWPVGYRLAFDIGDILIMCLLAGGDLQSLFEVIEQGPDFETALHLATLRADVQFKNGTPLYKNAFIENDKVTMELIGRWLLKTEFSDRILLAIDMIDDPRHRDVLELGFIAGMNS